MSWCVQTFDWHSVCVYIFVFSYCTYLFLPPHSQQAHIATPARMVSMAIPWVNMASRGLVGAASATDTWTRTLSVVVTHKQGSA
jgi:hypothetical protein